MLTCVYLQCLDLSEEVEESPTTVEFIDIVNDKVAEHHYKPTEDLTQFKSKVTGRGPLTSDWLASAKPVMCSYKCVEVKLDLWAFQSRIEEFIHKVRMLPSFPALFERR